MNTPGMRRARAFVLACLLVLPGTVMRGWPHLREVADASEVAETSSRVEVPRGGALPASAYRSWWPQRPPLPIRALGLAAEAGLHAVLLMLVLRSAALTALFSALPPYARAATALFSVVLMTGFLAGHKDSYPFVSWRMYANQPTPDPIIALVEGETRSGSTARVELAAVLPALGPRRLSHIVRQQAQALTEGGGAADEQRLSNLRKTLLAVADLYNSHHPDDPLVRIRVSLAIVPLDATAPPWLRHRHAVLGVDVERP